MIVDTKQMEFTFDAMNRRGNWPFCFTGTLLDDAEETVWLSLKLWFGLAKETVVKPDEARAAGNKSASALLLPLTSGATESGSGIA
ncbi:hypothetical protein NPIL_115051 [Nephila pilipes]|uniref:Uncharacterized protein n=1 Tax=Nephila pilipes TaxID=299642 RepID=A0A8X6I7Z4_NEPPI|nr:hypothetical protein NPIL_115051 [Nephila pilipes]